MHTFQAPKYVKLCTKFPCYSQIDEIWIAIFPW